MNYNNPDELKRMKELMKFGVNESSSKVSNVSRVEYKTKAANGKTYGIVYEGSRYYIKEAPKKDTEILAEDFSYIGGENNKKENEYSSYTLASKQLELKLMSINESHKEKTEIEQPKTVQSDWQVNETKEMRDAINRFKQISNNVCTILKEDKSKSGFTMEHTLPEAPDSHPTEKEVNSPFTDTAVANGDKDFKKTSDDHKKVGPFTKDGEVTNKEMESDKKPTENTDATYTEKAKYVPDNAVADKNPSGGKVAKVNENKRTFKVTESQILAWNNSKDFMDKSHGTEIGSSAPFTDELGKESNQTEANTEAIHEGEAVHNTDNQNSPAPGTSEVGDTAPFDNKVNEDQIPADAVAGMPNETDEEEQPPFPEVEGNGAYLDFEDEYNKWLDAEENRVNNDDDYEFDLGGNDLSGARDFIGDDADFNYGDTDEIEGSYFESKEHKVNEEKLDDFGKHPAYQKTPMTTPPNKEVAPNGAKEWDDESAQGEQPFGQKIGSSAPFDKIVKMIADSVMEKITEGFQHKA